QECLTGGCTGSSSLSQAQNLEVECGNRASHAERRRLLRLWPVKSVVDDVVVSTK
uniref:Uncharacterized protein n=1 Tax=Aegilops tauschii subsp. strangulata TaxID=200361 RepID=A0A453LZN5_AEGTS